jgi:hypothetical protein
MRKLITITIAIVLTLTTYSQKSVFSIGVGASYDYHINEYTQTPWPWFDHQYSNIFEFSLGSQFDIPIHNRLGIRTAISYSKKGYKLVYVWTTPDGGNGTDDAAIPMETQFKLKYIDIPLSVYYHIINKDRYKFGPSIGIINSINIANSEVSIMGNGNKKNTSYRTFRSTSYLYGARLGLINNIDLNKKIFLSLEPYLIYNFSIINETDIQKSDFAFGSYLSIHLRLNK